MSNLLERINLNNIRGLVRPMITILIILCLCAAFLFMVVKFSTQDLANNLITAFVTIGGTLIAFWFGSRNKPPAGS
jgi:hypothetical protein